MKVGVDARGLLGGRGIARYTRELLAALTHRFPEDEYRVLVHGGDRAHVPEGVVSVRDRRPQQLLFAAMAATRHPKLDRLLGDDLDVVWAPAPAPLALGHDVPFVLTLHDLSFEERPSDFTRYERLWHRAARPARLVHRADRVLADSVQTRDAAVARYGLAVDAVDVVLPGVTPAGPVARGAAVGTGTTQSPERPFFLAVGALEPRKAPEVLTAAFALARSHGLDADLVFAGTGRSEGRVGGPGVRLVGRVDDATLDALYRRAVAVVMPSWLEGFGFPPLEAATRGTPAIVSDLPVFDETLGEAALRVPAGDVHGFAEALLLMSRDRDPTRPSCRRLAAWAAVALDDVGPRRRRHPRRTAGRRRGDPPMSFSIVVALHDSAPDLGRLVRSLDTYVTSRSAPSSLASTAARTTAARVRKGMLVRRGRRGASGEPRVRGCEQRGRGARAARRHRAAQSGRGRPGPGRAPRARRRSGGCRRPARAPAPQRRRNGPGQRPSAPRVSRARAARGHPPSTASAWVLRQMAQPWRGVDTGEVGWAIAACVAARTATLRRLGPFDPAAFLFFEDLDLCLRARRIGVPTVLHPDLALRHAGRHSTGSGVRWRARTSCSSRRRREVVARPARAPGAVRRDDLLEALTFSTRMLAACLTRRPAGARNARVGRRCAPPAAGDRPSEQAELRSRRQVLARDRPAPRCPGRTTA